MGKIIDTWTLPHPENDYQQSVKDFWLCIMGTVSGDWLWTSMNDVLAAFTVKNNSDTLPAPTCKFTSTEHQQSLALYLGYLSGNWL